MQGEKRGETVLIEQVSQRIFVIVRIQQARLAQFVKPQDLENKAPELRFEQVAALGKQAVQRVAVVFEFINRIAYGKTHFRRLSFNAQFFEQGNKMRVCPGVIDNKTGIDGVFFSVGNHILRGSMSA
ncbi:hypothetical protein SRABI106_01128 [Rahnella aquatilis]|nr:hypothetical protein SRABI106_01128 [Rahnella aquatilis]